MADADHTYFGHDLEKLLTPCYYRVNMIWLWETDLQIHGYEKENKRMFHNFGNNLVRKIINLLFQCRSKRYYERLQGAFQKLRKKLS